MCSGNHALQVAVPIASPELATRAIVYRRELGLSADQTLGIIDIVEDWRKHYVELMEQIVRLGDEADSVLNNYEIDATRVKELAWERRQIIGQLEDDFVDAWISYQRELTTEQFDRLIDVYEQEFRELPHPILGVKNMHAAVG